MKLGLLLESWPTAMSKSCWCWLISANQLFATNWYISIYCRIFFSTFPPVLNCWIGSSADVHPFFSLNPMEHHWFLNQWSISPQFFFPVIYYVATLCTSNKTKQFALTVCCKQMWTVLLVNLKLTCLWLIFISFVISFCISLLWFSSGTERKVEAETRWEAHFRN